MHRNIRLMDLTTNPNPDPNDSPYISALQYTIYSIYILYQQ